MLASVLARVLGSLPDHDDSALLAHVEPVDPHDELLALLAVYDLSTAPIETLGERVRWQNHPAITALKWRLERRFEERLDRGIADDGFAEAEDAVPALRALAARDRVPPVYDWLASRATWDQLVAFLAVEGGPDGGFDDLVAVCQVGITGGPKVVLADNYWDELGRGQRGEVHTTLHDQLVDAIGMPRRPRSESATEVLQRSALNGLLATNRRLQPEMLGALGLLELQAGPRCRQVLRALQRLGAPREALPFYEVHALIDPRHGKEWLDGVVAPLVAAHPDWARMIIRGARWRSLVNAALFDRLHEDCTPHAEAA